MPISILEIFEDVKKDTANADQNGELTYAQFSRLSKRAELALHEWLTGGVTNERLPIPWVSQKNKDWLSFFITKFKTNPVNGLVERPADYYQYENLYRLGSTVAADCDEDDVQPDECNTPIEVLDGQQFYERCHTYIDELKPSIHKPIAKQVGEDFELMPKDMGSVCLEYIRLPKFGRVTGKIDPVFNEEVPDVVEDYEWGEWARPFLIWWITDFYTNKTREKAGKEFNAASNPKQ